MMRILYKPLENKINYKYYIEAFGKVLFSVYYDLTCSIVTVSNMIFLHAIVHPFTSYSTILLLKLITKRREDESI